MAMASGLASGGAKPVVAVYSTFLQRAIDQMIIDCCLPDLDVVFAVDRAGVVGEDGPTHHGMFDLVYTRMVPHMKVLAPSDEAELVHCAAYGPGPGRSRSPCAIRGVAARGRRCPTKPKVLALGESKLVREGGDVAILAFGRMVSRVLGGGAGCSPMRASKRAWWTCAG